jgi:hypothetical protein
MKHIYLPALLLIFSVFAHAGDVDRYMQGYAQTRTSDFKLEKEILGATRPEKLIRELGKYYSDTLSFVRQKAYYLTYKKGLHQKTNSPGSAIHKLLDGCRDKDGGIVGQNIGYLGQFNKKHFDKGALAQIESLLTRKRMPHYKDLILLAGFAGAGKEYLNRKMLEQGTPGDIRWHMALALARLGDKAQIAYCLGQIKKQPVNDQFVSSVLPYAVYIRQKEAVDYVVEILFQDKKLCHSLDPDNPVKIECGYRAMELLAPVTEGIPLKAGATGSITGMGYEEALATAREWFKENKGYKLKTDVF